MTGDAAVLGPVGDLGRRLEQEGVGALAEADHQDLLARRGLLQRCRQQQQGVRSAGVAAIGVQRIADGLVVDAGRLGDRAGDARERRRHAEVRDVLGRDLGILQAALDGGRGDRHVAGVANPALFPLVVVLVVDGAEVVDEVGGTGGLGQQLCHRLAFAHQDGGGPIAARHLDGTGGLGTALLGSHHQRLAVAAERLDQRRGAGPLGGGDIDSGDAVIEAQRPRDNARVQPVEEREGGGGKAQRGDAGAIAPGQRIAGGLHGHRHGVLVPVAKRALALGLTLQRRVEPAVRIGDRLARQPAPGNVGAERENAFGHCCP